MYFGNHGGSEFGRRGVDIPALKIDREHSLIADVLKITWRDGCRPGVVRRVLHLSCHLSLAHTQRVTDLEHHVTNLTWSESPKLSEG